jgi:hypothetical protein
MGFVPNDVLTVTSRFLDAYGRQITCVYCPKFGRSMQLFDSDFKEVNHKTNYDWSLHFAQSFGDEHE